LKRINAEFFISASMPNLLLGIGAMNFGIELMTLRTDLRSRGRFDETQPETK